MTGISNLLFARKVGSLSYKVGSCLVCISYNSLERPVRDKHSSLFGLFVKYIEKSFFFNTIP